MEPPIHRIGCGSPAFVAATPFPDGNGVVVAGRGTSSQCYGGHGERETPGLIPNPEAKPFSADGTARGTGWESRTPPDITQRNGGRSIALRPPFRAFVRIRRSSDRTAGSWLGSDAMPSRCLGQECAVHQ